MKIQKNVYVVLTEYQLLQAINIATGVYADPAVVNIIYIVREGTRLMTINADKVWSLDNIKIIIFDDRSAKEIAEILLRENPHHFLFFQAGFAINVYLAHTFAKIGVEISLGPDGYGCYAVFNKRFHLLSVAVDSFKQNYYLIINKLFSGKMHWFDYYTYGNHSFINNLWITHPKKYKHLAKNKLRIVPLPQFPTSSIDFISKIFNFNTSFPLEDAIYFFNQPFDFVLAEKEYDFLKQVLIRFPEKKVILKLHPLTNLETKLKYESLCCLKLIESNVPAEVLLLRLKNCIVFSGWSAALITENNSCNYYFNYPIYKAMNHLIVKQSNIVELDHIKMVSSPLEMKFPNE
jgi:hypothetical protein